MADSKKIEVTQVKSAIGSPKKQKATVKALGLRHIRHSVLHNDKPEIRGMIARVRHLVEVREI